MKALNVIVAEVHLVGLRVDYLNQNVAYLKYQRHVPYALYFHMLTLRLVRVLWGLHRF